MPRVGGGGGVDVSSVVTGAPAMNLLSLGGGDHLRGVRSGGEEARHPLERERHPGPDQDEVAVPPALEHRGVREHGDLADRLGEGRGLRAGELQRGVRRRC